MKENNKFSILFLIIKIILSLGILSLDIFLLYKLEYLNNLMYVDNLIGLLPLGFMFVFTISLCILIWKKHNKEKNNIVIDCILVFWLVITSSLFPNALRGNWFFGKEIKDIGTDGDISIYAPFKEDSKVAILEEPSTLSIDNNFPILDGALALYPVYSAIGQALYNKDNYQDEIRFTNTIRGFNALVDGKVDIFFSAYPSNKQFEYAKEKKVNLHLTPIGKEAFVFIVPKSNPINNLSYQQIRNIYSGKTSKWKTLGWNDGGRILKLQRPEGSGSQSTLQQIMKGLPLEVPQPSPNMDIIGTNSLMQQLTVEYKGKQPSLGYSYRFFALEMNPNENTKFLSIDGIEPNRENIQDGSYKFSTKFYAITVDEPKENTKKVVDWILSNQGQYLIEETGYIPI